jgi:hypothetical protein
MSVASASRIPTQAATTSISERVSVDRLTQFRGPWMDNGIATVRARVQGLMRRLVSLGAPIDGIVLSNETTLHAACFLGRDGALAAIQNDPRWPALARSMGLPTTIVDMDWGTDKYFQWTERMSGRDIEVRIVSPFPWPGQPPAPSHRTRPTTPTPQPCHGGTATRRR